MPGEIDILVLLNTNAFFGVAMFSPIYPGSSICVPGTVENSPLRSGAKHRRNKPPKCPSARCTSSLITGNIPILVQIIYLANYKCQGKNVMEGVGTRGNFPLLLHCPIAFWKGESIFQNMLLWNELPVIYGSWQDSMLLIPLICVFNLGFLQEKQRAVACVNLKSIANVPALDQGKFREIIYLKNESFLSAR